MPRMYEEDIEKNREKRSEFLNFLAENFAEQNFQTAESLAMLDYDLAKKMFQALGIVRPTRSRYIFPKAINAEDMASFTVYFWQNWQKIISLCRKFFSNLDFSYPFETYRKRSKLYVTLVLRHCIDGSLTNKLF